MTTGAALSQGGRGRNGKCSDGRNTALEFLIAKFGLAASFSSR